MEFFTSRHAGPTQGLHLTLCGKANLKAQRGSRPAQNFNAPYKISELKITPCGQLHCRHRSWHSTLLRRARPTACLLPPPQDLGAAAPSDPQQTPLHTGCRPIRSGKTQGPLRPISGPRRCRSRCRREYAHLRDLPRCGDPPHREIYLLGQSAHRENKNLGISATFLRLRTLPYPGKAK